MLIQKMLITLFSFIQDIALMQSKSIIMHKVGAENMYGQKVAEILAIVLVLAPMFTI